MKNTVIANRKKGDWEIIKKYFEDRGVDTNCFIGANMECEKDETFYYGIIDGNFLGYSLKKAQQANATILEVSDIDKEFKVGDVVKVVKPCSTSENKIGHIGKITDIQNSSLADFGKCTIYEIDGKGDGCQASWEHYSGLELIVPDTVTLPKSFVLEAHKSACSDWKKRIEEVVPELFPKNELIVGKWYKYNNWLIVYGGKNNNGVLLGSYGFDYDGNWDEGGKFGIKSNEWQPATEQEVFDALKNEALKRGFKEGVKYNPISKIGECGYGIVGNHFRYYDNSLHNGLQYIFSDGKWAEIISEPIPDELQNLIKKLGKDKIIEILNSN